MLKYKIRTSLGREDVMRKIADLLVEDNKLAGSVSDDGFKIRRIPSMFFRNSFLPVFIGKIDEGENGCTVHIKARLHRFVGLFMIIWLAVFGLAFMLIDHGRFLILCATFVPVILIIFATAFYIPTRRVINTIRSLLR